MHTIDPGFLSALKIAIISPTLDLRILAALDLRGPISTGGLAEILNKSYTYTASRIARLHFCHLINSRVTSDGPTIWQICAAPQFDQAVRTLVSLLDSDSFPITAVGSVLLRT